MIQSLVNKHFYNLFVFTLTFGILLYDAIGFDYTDEFCALFLFLLFGISLFASKEWAINKAFLLTIGIFLFYLFYSFYIGSNVKVAIVTDLLIQIKPYLAFFCVYAMIPHFSLSQKNILKSIALIYWGILFLIGVADLFIPRTIYNLMGHPSYYAAAVVITSLCYLYCSNFTKLEKLSFLLLLSIGIISGRSKFYGFFALATFITLYFSNIKRFKLDFKNLLIIILMLGAIVFVAREKVYFYFYQTVTSDVDKDMIARYVLYATAPEILTDYFPFGSGFASYGTYSSGVYYSKIYEEYGIDGVWGMSKGFYNYIADTYYPSLAQFGVVGILLYISFWIYVLKKSFVFFVRTKDAKYLIMISLITGFLAIEGTTDSTFTTHRGFFIMMLLGLLLSDMKYARNELNEKEQLTDENSSNQ